MNRVSRSPAKVRPRMRGFSLIELTVVLVILGIIGVLLVRWLGIAAQENAQATQRELLQRSVDAIVGFATIQSRLPCPDVNNDGREDCAGAAVGTLPYVTLGLPDTRAARVRYGVLRRTGESIPLAGWDAVEKRASNIATPLNADLAMLRDQAAPLRIIANSPKVAPIHGVLLWDSCARRQTGGGDCTDLPQLKLNSVDFCDAVRNASMLPPNSQYVHTTKDDAPTAIAGNVAYALALPDAQAPAPAHTGGSVAFHSPRQPSGAPGDYHDKVVAVGTDELWTRLRCGEHYGPSLYAHANVAIAAGLTSPAMSNFLVQLEIMAKLAEANSKSADVALIDAIADMIGTTADTFDTISEMLDTYGGWSWRVAIASGAIGTAVGSVIAAGVAKGAAAKFSSSSASNLDDFASYPGEAKALENQIVDDARRSDMLGGFPDQRVRDAAIQFRSAGSSP